MLSERAFKNAFKIENGLKNLAFFTIRAIRIRLTSVEQFSHECNKLFCYQILTFRMFLNLDKEDVKVYR